MPDVPSRNRCGFGFDYATLENISSITMGKVITFQPENHIF
jgi:hypothetical protein